MRSYSQHHHHFVTPRSSCCMSGICSCCLDAEGRDLDVAVDVEAVVLAGEHHAPVVHQRYVEALRVLHLHQIVKITNLPLSQHVTKKFKTAKKFHSN